VVPNTNQSAEFCRTARELRKAVRKIWESRRVLQPKPIVRERLALLLYSILTYSSAAVDSVVGAGPGVVGMALPEMSNWIGTVTVQPVFLSKSSGSGSGDVT
jgi:uncharacterized BrkB/YihY/UPF0761 family membrane protein